MSLSLVEVREVERYGERATFLGQALRANLPVPDGWAIDLEGLTRIAAGEPAQVPLGGALVVRASAVGDDTRERRESRAVLNVVGDAEVDTALRAIASSPDRPAARAHRERNGLVRPRLAAVVQRLVPADISGTLTTIDPDTGESLRVVHAVLGLDRLEGVVPDRYRIARGGQRLAAEPGRMGSMIVAEPGGGIVQRPVAHDGPCLGDGALVALDALARSCESLFRGPLELDWAFSGGMSWLVDVKPLRSPFLPR